MKRKLLWLLLILASFGAVLFLRRRGVRRSERVDLYYEDGSMVSLEEGSPAAARLLPIAADLLRAARA